MRTAPLLALLSVTAVACAGAQDDSPFDEVRSSLERDSAPVVSETSRVQSARDNADFAVALFKQIALPTQNLM